jgi:hypothetical protein
MSLSKQTLKGSKTYNNYGCKQKQINHSLYHEKNKYSCSSDADMK